MSQSQNKGTAIVLNRMYAGNYLASNLGHEVINMFQADNGKHYLYLNPKGNFSEKGQKVGTMLLVRGIGEGRVEVVGMAKNLNVIESACCTLPRDIGKIEYQVREAQKKVLEKVEYGGVPIFDIFGEEGQQSVYASYWVENGNLFIPKAGKRLILKFSKKNQQDKNTASQKQQDESTDPDIKVVILENHHFASIMLHQFILDGEDLNKLNVEICNNETLWEVSNNKLDLKKYNNFGERKISLFDICQIQNDENRFSNALSYFIQQYPELWQNLLQDKTDIKDLGKIESVTREEDAKVDKGEYKSKTGGRIDLLIRTKNYYIIVENKIDSQIIEENGVTQLSRYYHYVKYLKEEQLEKLDAKREKIEEKLKALEEKYEDLKNKDGARGCKWANDIESYNKDLKSLMQQRADINNRNIIGIVLTPDYNKPDSDKLKVEDAYSYINLTYSGIYNWLSKNEKLDKDVNFKSFYDAMKRHTYEYESAALYADMLEKFVRRIKANQDKK